MNALSTFSIAQLKHAVVLRERIASLERELAALVGGASAPATMPTPTKKKGGMSAAGRAAVAAAQKARWAKIKAKPVVALNAGGNPPVKPAAPKPTKKWKLSAAGLAKIKAASKAYWAKKKVAGSNPAVKPAAPKPAKKWKLSAAGLAKIKAANKAYWAKKKAGK